MTRLEPETIAAARWRPRPNTAERGLGEIVQLMDDLPPVSSAEAVRRARIQIAVTLKCSGIHGHELPPDADRNLRKALALLELINV